MLADLFTADSILLDVAGGDKPQVFRLLAESLGLSADESAQLVSALVEREQQGSTAIGSGVAVPHSRLEFADRERLAYGRLASPLDWGAPDGLPVRHVFLILAPPVAVSNRHLQILAAVARLVRDDGVRERLAGVADPAEFLSLLRSGGA